MKRLTDRDLNFPMYPTLQWASLTAVTNSSLDYTLSISGATAGMTPYTASYEGNIFFYSTAQTIDYGFMLYNFKPGFETPAKLTQALRVTLTIPDLLSGTTGYTATEYVACVEGDLVDDATILSTGQTTTGYMIPPVVETPKGVPGQEIPVMLYCDFTPTARVYLMTGNTTGSTTATTTMFVPVDTDFTVKRIPRTSTGAYPTITTKYPEICAPYAVVWYDNRGFWQSQPFWGSLTNKYEFSDLTNIGKEINKYATDVRKTWKLRSDYVHKQETYEGLFTSQYVYIYDAAEAEYHKVIVTDTNYQYKRSRKAFYFNLNVKEDYNYISK